MPLLIGGCLVVVMLTWRKGARILAQQDAPAGNAGGGADQDAGEKPPPRVPGTAVFLTAAPESAPTALLHSLKHYKVLHENNVILTIVTENIPRVAPQDRVEIETIGETSCA